MYLLYPIRGIYFVLSEKSTILTEYTLLFYYITNSKISLSPIFQHYSHVGRQLIDGVIFDIIREIIITGDLL